MRCPRCGGNIFKNENSQECSISYRDMVYSIRHDEMKDLFERMDAMMKRHEDISIESSLMACEISNSSLLVPVIIENNMLKVMTAAHPLNRKVYIPLFTDMEEYDKCVKEIEPVTNPFKVMLTLLDEDVDGFIINAGGMCCVLTREYLDLFFADNEN